MQICIANGQLALTLNTLGAEMLSLKDTAGREYLWNGDPAYWSGHAPNLFPFIGRLTNNSYRLKGKTYPLSIHGFAKTQEFRIVSQDDDCVTLELTQNETTLAQYPFDFSFRITYALKETSLHITFRVENHSQSTMPFAVGGHPGFAVPFVPGEKFEDYELEFSQACLPQRIGFTPSVYLSGVDQAYPLEDDRRLPLQHKLFDEDAIILKNMARSVTLRSRVSGKSLTVSYPQMPYLGFWHKPKTDAPYVCIEPWSSLPARQDVVEELTCKSDMLQLEPGLAYTNQWQITIS